VTPGNSGWDEHADWWIEGFTGGVDPEYEEQIIPLAVEEASPVELARADGAPVRVLDVGCGEGQISRALAAAGCAVTGVDPTERNIRTARARGGGPSYLLAGAEELPFGDAEFDVVIACLVFEHIDLLETAVSEVSRVLRQGGRFAFFLNHPLLQTPGSGWIDDHIIDPPEQYWRIGPYLTETATHEEVEPGVRIRFVHRPLSRYVNCLAAHGLLTERMVEPPPPDGFLARAPEYVLAHTVPRLLYLRTTKHVRSQDPG
jgi:SAM-dependent methyltransferase